MECADFKGVLGVLVRSDIGGEVGVALRSPRMRRACGLCFLAIFFILAMISLADSSLDLGPLWSRCVATKRMRLLVRLSLRRSHVMVRETAASQLLVLGLVGDLLSQYVPLSISLKRDFL